ncbi:hypothetical protein B0H11DRAFT_1913091 [Mycena galericulata]|nr:hypothetical protein B0H11DRAFT_1913091 [Mycena galericulata]
MVIGNALLISNSDSRANDGQAKFSPLYTCKGKLSAGKNRKRHQELIAHEKIPIDKKKQDEVEKKARDTARKAEVANLTPYLDTEWIQASHTGIKGTDVEKQINWHRQFIEKEVIPGKTVIHMMPKTDKVTQPTVAVTWFNRDILLKLQLLSPAAITASIFDDEIPEGDADIPMVDNWDAQEDLDDEDMLDNF